MQTWTEFKKSDLLTLPKRDWGKTTTYTSILLVSTRTKHDSGYNLFTVIGVDDGEPIEIAGYMDDLILGEHNKTLAGSVHIDCSMRGVFQVWGPGCNFQVPPTLSTTVINVIEGE